MSGQPWKDTFHSTHVQPEAATDGDVPGDILNEHYPDLHSAVSLFSKGTGLLGRHNWPFRGRPWSPDIGPFVPGDRIGYENEHITAKAYNKDGLLLQMGDSMKPIDEIIKSKAGIHGLKLSDQIIYSARVVRQSLISGSSRFWRIPSWKYQYFIIFWWTIRITG